MFRMEDLMGPLGLPEILIIFLIVMVLFGAKKLPEIGRGMGKAIKGFKNSIKDDPKPVEEGEEEEE